MSANHNGDINNAFQIIKSAKENGANSIKIQTYRPDTITIDSDKDDFKIKDGLWKGQTLYDLYEWAHTPWDWHKPIMKHAKSRNLLCFSSPFDESAIDFLETLDVPAYKIASFECIDLPLIKKSCKYKKTIDHFNRYGIYC